jgi:WD40 repeat protein
MQSVHSAFGDGVNESHSIRREDKVVALFAIDNTVIAVSPRSTVAVYEVVRLAPSSSAVGSITVQKALILRARFRLGLCDSPLTGVQLGMPRKSQSGPILLVTTHTALTSYNLSDNQESLGGELSVPSLDPYTDPLEIDPILQTLRGRVIYSFHGSHIDHLCLSNHSSVLTTLSKKERSVRVWDGASPFYPPEVIEDYSERCDSMPIVIDLHPSGWTMACAFKDGTVSEFGVAFSGLHFLRQMVDARAPFVSSDRTSYATASPVSLLKVRVKI